MTFTELKNLYEGRTIMFTNGITDTETYAEEHMKARVLSIVQEHDGEVLRVYFDYSEFDEYNKQYETYNFYDDNGDPCLNARDAGYYTVRDTIYLDAVRPITEYMVIADELLSYFNERDGKHILREGFHATFGKGTPFMSIDSVNGDDVRISGLIGAVNISDIQIHKLVRML